MQSLELLIAIVEVLILLFIPGYFLTLAFFSKASDIDVVERVAFSYLFSIVFWPLLILVENQLFLIPINFTSVAASFLLLIIFGLLVWMIRTQKFSVPAALYKAFPKVDAKEAVSMFPKIK